MIANWPESLPCSGRSLQSGLHSEMLCLQILFLAPVRPELK